MIFDTPHRSRRFRRFLWPILLIVAVTLGLVVSGAGTQTRNRIAYLSRVGDQTTELAKGAEALRQLTGELHLISRVDFETVVGGVREDLAVSAELAAEDVPDLGLVPIRALFRQSVSAWTRGLEGYAESVLGAADRPNDPTPIDQMAASLAELRAGDAIYAELLVEMAREDVPDGLAPFPEVVMTPEEGGLVGLALDYMEAARSELNSLGLRPGLGVSQVVADPEWQVDAAGQVVLSPTESVVFSVVMTNTGNIATMVQDLTLTMVGGPESVEVVREVAPLQPGRQVTIVFDALVVEPGGIYQVAAEIETVAEDANIEDNQVTVQFVVGEG
ncbi:MAG: hypothetical protein L0Z63_02520 [Actinobacteria bacterium]|nr:hypothetical protein [Actinomycetota bacterium]